MNSLQRPYKGAKKPLKSNCIITNWVILMKSNYKCTANYLVRTFGLFLICLGVLAQTPEASAQAITTGHLIGRVQDREGNTLSDARITLRHEPTGSVQTTTSRGNGTFAIRGLRVGGPYTAIVERDAFETFVRRGISVDITSATELVVVLSEEVVEELEAFTITASEFDRLLSGDRTGSVTQLGSRDLASTPVGDRSLNSLLRLDPRVTYNRNPQDQAISAAGVSNRYNRIAIDGVSANDPFGLNSNGMAGARNVVPLYSIEAISISTSPFDARQGGFTGASINAVTKSGTNTLSGSLYYIYRDQNMVRENLETHTGQIITVPDFKERTYGGELGGPIIPDHLFFYITYEGVREDRNPPAITNFPTSAALTEITANARALGFNPGSVEDPVNELKDDNLLIKLDWQINNDHRFTARYNNVDSSRPTFPGYGGRNFSFESHWYDQVIENTSYIVQLVSNWTDDFSTDVSISYNEYYSEPLSSQRSPQVIVFDVPVEGTTQLGSVRFGTERSRHFNRLEVDTWTADFFAEYRLDDRNSLTFGYQMNRSDIFNAFVQDFLGNYEFTNPEALAEAAAGQSGWAGRYRYQFENPGINPAAEFREYNHALFVQNQWFASQRLTLTYGLRIDIPDFAEAPPENQRFEEVFGFRSNHTYSGNAVIQPRIGFNWKADDEGYSQIRGGIGLFYGQMPRVWMSNSYSNTGMNFSSIDVRNAENPVPSGDPDNQPLLDPAATAMQVNAIDPDFELPSRWKGVLAFDQRVGNLVFSIEGEYSMVNRDVLYQNINREVAVVAFDGREILGDRVSDEFVNDTIFLTNTKKGWSRSIAYSVERPRQDDGWSWRISYVNSHVREVQYGTSSVARSNWANRAVLNQGENVTSRGELEIRHRFLAMLQKSMDWNREGFRTTVSLLYEGRSGLPFSFVYSGSVNNDGVNFNDLIYVPERGDSRVQFATPADEELFFQMVDRWNLTTGAVAESGARRYPFVHQFDLSIAQEIKLPGWRHSLELTLDILNIGNLINSSWGQIRGSNSFFVKTEGAANASYDAATDTYTYSNVNAELANGRFSPFNSRGEPDASRWSAMAGIRYRF